MKTQSLKLLILFLLYALPAISQSTYNDTDKVPGRGRWDTKERLKYNEFFDQSKIPGNPNKPQIITLKANDVNASDLLTEKIKEVSKSKNGYLLLKQSGKGTVLLNRVQMESNVHLLIEADVKLGFPDQKTGIMFVFGDTDKISNVAITCAKSLGNTTNRNDWFDAELFTNLNGKRGAIDDNGTRANRTFAKISNVENFKLSGIEFDDFYTEINAINLTTATLKNKDGSLKDSRKAAPNNGILSNMHMSRGEDGYGLMQSQAAINVLFYNLHSTDGGVIVRFESGSPASNNAGFKRAGVPNNPVNVVTLDELYVRNISAVDGTLAMYINPHRVKQGVIDVDDISTKGCFTTIDIENGFKDRNNNPNIADRFGPAVDQAGSFDENTIITNVRTESGGERAGYGRPAARYLTCEAFNKVRKLQRGDGSFPYKSMGSIRDNARRFEKKGHGNCVEGCYNIQYPAKVNLKGNNYARGKEGFDIFSEKKLVSEIDARNNYVCRSIEPKKSSKIIGNTSENISIKVFPNPSVNTINLSQQASWKLYSFSGKLITNGKGNNIDVAPLAKGIYYLELDNKAIHKIIKD